MSRKALKDRFSDIVAEPSQLRDYYGDMVPLVANKVIDHIDDHCSRFIAVAPFVGIASRAAPGHLDLSPKGDPPGFVSVLDEHTLAIPDRPGNNRVDTFTNVLCDPNIGLLFIVPTRGEVLRVSGKGVLTRDPELRERLQVHGREPKMVLVMDVERVLFHCSKWAVRSGFWKPEKWPEVSRLPNLATVARDHADTGETLSQVQDLIDDSIANKLY